MNKKILISVALALVVGFFVGQNVSIRNFGGVVVHNVSESFDAGIEVNGTSVIDSSRNASFVSVTTGSSGLTLGGCGTVTYNPPSLAGLATTTKDVTVSGALTSDLCSVSLTSATSSAQTVQMSCSFWASGSSTVLFQNIGGTQDHPTGTLRVCPIH